MSISVACAFSSRSCRWAGDSSDSCAVAWTLLLVAAGAAELIAVEVAEDAEDGCGCELTSASRNERSSCGNDGEEGACAEMLGAEKLLGDCTGAMAAVCNPFAGEYKRGMDLVLGRDLHAHDDGCADPDHSRFDRRR